MRFIAGIKGRNGVEDAMTRLGLIPLHKRKRNQRLRLLMRFLAKEKHHSLLSESYKEIEATCNDYDNKIADMWDPSYLPN